LRKLSRVVRDQNYVQHMSVTPDERVEGSNRPPPAGYGGTHLPVAYRRQVIEGSDLQSQQELVQGGMRLLWPAALGGPKRELTQGYR